MQTPCYDVVIIGGGASGLLSALECARGGLRALVLEKEPFIGRKILVSGNGRCNLTNLHAAAPYYHGDKQLIQATLHQFSAAACCRYFENLGVLLNEETQGRIFPATGKATAVVEALKLALQENGVSVQTKQEVVKIKRGKPFILRTQNGDCFQARRVVLACGSCAYPQVSGTQSGYTLAEQLGHSVVAPRPTLSAICLQEKALARLAGIRSQVRLSVWQENKITDEAEGEVLFTPYGLSGPAALNVSGTITRALANGPVHLTLNLFPQVKQIQTVFEPRFTQFATRKPKDFLAGLLHENIANLLVDFIGLRKNKPMREQSPSALARLTQTLQAWPLTALSLRPWNEAMAAAGGVKVREINYNTFESLCCPGVFITGELLDVDGKSGGFNLQFAWASGFAAARQLIKEQEHG